MGIRSNFVDLGFGRNAPAIWLYPPAPLEVKVGLTFRGNGFMTLSAPAYNNAWYVEADASEPLPRVRGVYDGGGAFTFLDYDGFRDGDFQTGAGWVVEQKDLLRWQRAQLAELGFRENEIDDVNYSYGRLLLMRGYKERFFLVYPQVKSVIDDSVELRIEPPADSVYRLWLYFVPSDDPPAMTEPRLASVIRSGFTAVELGFLTDSEIATTPANDADARRGATASGSRRTLSSPRRSAPIA